MPSKRSPRNRGHAPGSLAATPSKLVSLPTSGFAAGVVVARLRTIQPRHAGFQRPIGPTPAQSTSATMPTSANAPGIRVPAKQILHIGGRVRGGNAIPIFLIPALGGDVNAIATVEPAVRRVSSTSSCEHIGLFALCFRSHCFFAGICMMTSAWAEIGLLGHRRVEVEAAEPIQRRRQIALRGMNLQEAARLGRLQRGRGPMRRLVGRSRARRTCPPNGQISFASSRNSAASRHAAGGT